MTQPKTHKNNNDSCNERMAELFVSTEEMEGLSRQMGLIHGAFWGRCVLSLPAFQRWFHSLWAGLARAPSFIIRTHAPTQTPQKPQRTLVSSRRRT